MVVKDPTKAEEALEELRRSYAQVRVLFSTDTRDNVRKTLKTFGECMAKLEEAFGLVETETATPELPKPETPEAMPLEQAAQVIASELKQIRIVLEKRFEDSARPRPGR